MDEGPGARKSEAMTGTVADGEGARRTDYETAFPPAMPAAVAERVRAEYAKASTILEYGSGGSTAMAAALGGKSVFTVESDSAWLVKVRDGLEGADGDFVFHHADVGPVGAWGTPKDRSKQEKWPSYPTWIWMHPKFRQPDLVLIDGRFRPACLIATMLFTRAPVRVLFDDYYYREEYFKVEAYAKPVDRAGYMAIFEIKPRPTDPRLVLRLFEYSQHHK